MNILDFFYTEGQAAQALNVNRLTIWRWIKEGKLDIQRVGREVLIPKWEIELMKSNRQKCKKLTSVKALKLPS